MENKFIRIKRCLEDWFGTELEDGENDAVIYEILEICEK